MSNLILLSDNNYYFRSDAIAVYPCAYRGGISSTDPNTPNTYTYFDPASRYTSEENITSAVVGLTPKGTYVSNVSEITTPVNVGGIDLRRVKAGPWKFTIGGYNFEAQIDSDDWDMLTGVLGGKAVKFEINPQKLPDSDSLGRVLTSYETPTDGPTNLDQATDSIYRFTGLKVTVITSDSVELQPTSTTLIPVLYTTIDEKLTLVLNQYARLPEITHGRTEGEAEVTKLNVLENITLATADAYDLLVENQLVVGTNRDANNTIFKVALNRDGTGAVQQPSIEVKTAPVTIDKAPVTISSASVTIKADSSTPTATVLSVEGGAGVTEDFTVTKKTTTGTLSVASGNFEVDSNGGTTIKNNLTTIGNTTIEGTLKVARDFNINPGTTEDTLAFKVDADSGNTNVAGTLTVDDSTTIKNGLLVKDGATEKFKVDLVDDITSINTGNTTITGTLRVGPNSNPSLTVVDGTTTLKSIAITNDTESDASTSGALVVTGGAGIGKNLNVNGNLSAGNIVSSKTSGETAITGELTVKNSSNQPRFSVTDTEATIATSTTKIGGDLNVNSGKFLVTAERGNTTVAGTLDVANNTTIKQNLIVMNGANEKFKVEADTGKATINGALEVTGTSANLGNGAVQINANQVIINKATQISGMLRAEGGLRVVDESTFDVDTSGNLTAASVTTGTLNVPNYDGKGYASFSLGSKVENDDGMVTRSLYFQDENSSESEEYVLTPTVAKAALLDMIYPAGSIYMTLENLVSTHELTPITKIINKKRKTGYAIFDPSNTTNPAGGLWAPISGRVLLGAGTGKDDEGNTQTFSAADANGNPITGGYYNPQPWEHTHKYYKANTSTGGHKLTMDQLPRKDFDLRLLVAVSGGDDEAILRWCGGWSGLDSLPANEGFSSNGIRDAQDSGSNARVGGTQVYTNSNKYRETEGAWRFHYGGNSTAHNHSIGSDKTDTDDNPTTSSTNGNLPPYLVCYIWQRIV